MSFTTILYATICGLFSMAVIEAYLELVDAYRRRWIVLFFYLIAVGIFFFVPMFSVSFVKEHVAFLSNIRMADWLVVWLGLIVVYMFVRRKKLLQILDGAGP